MPSPGYQIIKTSNIKLLHSSKPHLKTVLLKSLAFLFFCLFYFERQRWKQCVCVSALLVYSGLQQPEFRAEHSCSAGARRAGTRVSLCGSTRNLRHHLHRYTSVLTSIEFLLDSLSLSLWWDQVILLLSCTHTCAVLLQTVVFLWTSTNIYSGLCRFSLFPRDSPKSLLISSSSPLWPPVSFWSLQDEVLCHTCRLPHLGCHRHRAASRPFTSRSPR